MLFQNHQNRVFGLDLTDVSLKLVQLDNKSGALAVQSYSDFAVPKDIITADKVVNPGGLADTIKKAVGFPKFGKITTPYVVASLPETKCFVRVIQMPMMSEKEAQEAVPWEAEAYIPLPISQVYLDWLILNPADKPADKNKMTVLITAAPKDYIDDLVSILKEAGLKPVALEAESQATARSVVSKNANETVLIADINTVRTSLIIYDKGVLQFTSSLPIAGNMMTESVAKTLSVSFDEAEKLKRQVGAGEESAGMDPKTAGKVRKAILPIVDNLVDEMKNTIRFYEEHSAEGNRIGKLWLVGGSSKLKHLPSFLHEKFTHKAAALDHPLRSLPGMKVELGNPWINVLAKGQTPPMSRENSLSFATAIGLAMREIE